MKIDPQLSTLLPPLSEEELAALERSIAADGVRDPVVLWKEEELLLDGHNRERIARKLKIECPRQFVSLPSRAAAEAWMWGNQLARRNLTDEQRQYAIGKAYLAEKKAPGGRSDRKLSGCQNGSPKTAERLAKDHGVSPRSVHRAAQFAQAVDAVEKEAGSSAKEQVLNGSVPLPQNQVAAVTARKVTFRDLVKEAEAAARPSTKEEIRRQRAELTMAKFAKAIIPLAYYWPTEGTRREAAAVLDFTIPEARPGTDSAVNLESMEAAAETLGAFIRLVREGKAA